MAPSTALLVKRLGAICLPRMQRKVSSARPQWSPRCSPLAKALYVVAPTAKPPSSDLLSVSSPFCHCQDRPKAPTAALRVIVSASTPRASISPNSRNPSGHSRAAAAALYVTVSGSISRSSKLSTSRSTTSHCLASPMTLMAALPTNTPSCSPASRARQRREAAWRQQKPVPMAPSKEVTSRVLGLSPPADTARRQASARRQRRLLSKPPMAQPYTIRFGYTARCALSARALRTTCHCRPLSMAQMAALSVTTSGSKARLRIDCRQKPRASAHC
mmetsp:Transcript_44090/g.105515  ORF Transcript_44090/g.105515 Transcript_44090/m.105515 type:complete len:274 (+) Transcript_44090:342-1163(+)